MATKAICDIPVTLREAAVVKATGNTYNQKDGIKRAGATFMTHAGKFWAWNINQCERANDIVNSIPGVGASTCIVTALASPEELTTALEQWYQQPLNEWATSGSSSRSYYVDKTRTRIKLIGQKLGVSLDEDNFEENEGKILRALKTPEKRKLVMDDTTFKIAPKMSCIEPSKELASKIEKGTARVVPSRKYDLGYKGKYDSDVKRVNPGILEIFVD